MFGQGGGPFGTEAVQKESFGGKSVPKAFAQVGKVKPTKKRRMHFGPPAKSTGLDYEAIMRQK